MNQAVAAARAILLWLFQTIKQLIVFLGLACLWAACSFVIARLPLAAVTLLLGPVLGVVCGFAAGAMLATDLCPTGGCAWNKASIVYPAVVYFVVVAVGAGLGTRVQHSGNIDRKYVMAAGAVVYILAPVLLDRADNTQAAVQVAFFLHMLLKSLGVGLVLSSWATAVTERLKAASRAMVLELYYIFLCVGALAACCLPVLNYNHQIAWNLESLPVAIVPLALSSYVVAPFGRGACDALPTHRHSHGRLMHRNEQVAALGGATPHRGRRSGRRNRKRTGHRG